MTCQKGFISWEWGVKFIGFQNMGKEDIEAIKIPHFNLYLKHLSLEKLNCCSSECMLLLGEDDS